MNLKSSLLVLLAGTSLMVATGCTTKNYVRKQTQPIVDKSNELDARTAKNNAAIHDVDTRATAGISGANTKPTPRRWTPAIAQTRPRPWQRRPIHALMPWPTRSPIWITIAPWLRPRSTSPLTRLI